MPGIPRRPAAWTAGAAASVRSWSCPSREAHHPQLVVLEPEDSQASRGTISSWIDSSPADMTRPRRSATAGSVAQGPVIEARPWPGLTVHDAVIGTPGPGGAGTGTVPGQHLRGDPAVQLHQVPLRPAAVQPGAAEMMPEPVRVDIHAGLLAAPLDHLVDSLGAHRPPVAGAEPQP